jgi:4-hydroxy-2-oxoheptanedioate aldolase
MLYAAFLFFWDVAYINCLWFGLLCEDAFCVLLNMEIPKNYFKDALRNGRVQYGLWLGLGDPLSSEVCAGAGYDWLLIDSEHGPNDLRSIFSQVQAVSSYPSHPVVRPPQGDHVLIKQLLETGVQTLLIPMVESAEQARGLVMAMRYPPNGIRGVGSALARASRWGRIIDYVKKCNSEMCLLVQVETQAGYESLDEIIAVDGVDGVFFGAADLAASYGYLGDSNHPDIVRKIESGLQRVQASGKSGGVLCSDKGLNDRYQAAGARFIAVGVDALLLADATSRLLSEYCPRDGCIPYTGNY